ncbi:MAG: fibrillarin-like rRNA/tRNA 2'-O-methyltransferase [Candidatus Thermoplasmatota archaeon]|nr:fibrillarin-like rRNA/tRNA 2'-O-methyltransferase [Candidatus Thermoplasmatota archaeon]
MKQVFPGVYSKDKKLYTLNLVPGERVYNEHLLFMGGKEYRSWNPYKSKMAAAILKGLKVMPVKRDSRVLYLGAANGTTVSHLSDVSFNGIIYAVEISARAMRDLVKVCDKRQNIVPILADACKPEKYEIFIDKPVDLIYQDISQRDQVGIFIKNMEKFEVDEGMLMVKARSMDVSMPPKRVFEKVKKEISNKFDVKEAITLAPYSKDHMALVIG